MSTILELREIYFPKLNNAEFTFFSGQICTYINQGTTEALHVPEDVFLAFSKNYDRLVELVRQSRIADETAEIATMEKSLDGLLSSIFMTAKAGCSNPIPEKQTAAQTLVNVMKPYFGLQSYPQRQKLRMVEGLLVDLKKEGMNKHLTALGFTDEIMYLEELSGGCIELITKRAAKQMANLATSAKPIRVEMYDQYNTMVKTIWAFSVATPSDVFNTFIAQVNKLIADTEMAYNQRMAEHPKSTEKNKDQ